MSLVRLSVLERRWAECGGFLWFVARRQKLGGNAGWRGGHAFHAGCGAGKTCFRDGVGW